LPVLGLDFQTLAVAMNRLESAVYYQKTWSLDDYIDEFQDLVVEARYTDPKMAVLKFRRGLNPQTQNAVIRKFGEVRYSNISFMNPSQYYIT
jgi:hypothetical protein